VLDAVARALGLSDEHTRESRAVLREHGNMSSPTVLFVVDRLRARRDDLRPIVLLAFGPGLTGEASLIRPTPDRPQGWPA
jgi:predicted naringenin-chalcone synthase